MWLSACVQRAPFWRDASEATYGTMALYKCIIIIILLYYYYYFYSYMQCNRPNVKLVQQQAAGILLIIYHIASNVLPNYHAKFEFATVQLCSKVVQFKVCKDVPPEMSCNSCSRSYVYIQINLQYVRHQDAHNAFSF